MLATVLHMLLTAILFVVFFTFTMDTQNNLAAIEARTQRIEIALSEATKCAGTVRALDEKQAAEEKCYEYLDAQMLKLYECRKGQTP